MLVTLWRNVTFPVPRNIRKASGVFKTHLYIELDFGQKGAEVDHFMRPLEWLAHANTAWLGPASRRDLPPLVGRRGSRLG